MKIPPVAQEDSAISLARIWQATRTSLVAIAVAMLAMSRGGGDPAGTAMVFTIAPY